LTAQFDAAEALLKDIQAETSAVRELTEDQKAKVERATAEVEAAVKEMREGEGRTRDEMREIRQEVDTIQEMLPKVGVFDIVLQSLTNDLKMLEKNKEAQTQSLAELQQELKSLKTLLLSRGPSASAPGTSTPPSHPLFTGRPSIPAWQLVGTDASGSTTPTPPVASGSETKLPDITDSSSNLNGVNNGIVSP
jgi:peroxin-14